MNDRALDDIAAGLRLAVDALEAPRVEPLDFLKCMHILESQSRHCNFRLGGVYVAEAVGARRVKIGWSTNPKVRRASLQTACPFPVRFLSVFPGTQSTEAELHVYFAALRACLVPSGST